MTIEREEFVLRLDILMEARDFVTSIFEKYPPETYKTISQSAPIFSAAPNYTTTQAEQYISSVLNVADWLLKEHD